MQRRHREVPHPSRTPRTERDSRAALGGAAGSREPRTNSFAWQCLRSSAHSVRRCVFRRAASLAFFGTVGGFAGIRNAGRFAVTGIEVPAGKFRGRGSPMKCTTVRTKLAGYLDDAITGGARVAERVQIRQHLEACGVCREELERFRKLSVVLSRVPRNIPPADLAVRIKVAAAQAQHSQDWPSRLRRIKDRAEILFDNVFRPLTLPATGGFFSAILVFVLVLQMIVPGTTVHAVQNDVALNLMRPAELVSLSEYPQAWVPEQNDLELSLPHGLLLDVTVDAQGHMTDYQILSGPNSLELRRQLDQMLLFSRFSPMLSFGRPTAGGHVVLSFSAVRVRG